jgi:mersacidin/lichenicidin family type 2 lantibiotic
MKIDIVRAWKDDAYRQSLSSEELAMLPENPVGEFELTEADLEAVYGGHNSGGASPSTSNLVCVGLNSTICGSAVCGSAVCGSAVLCGTVAILGGCN